MKTERRKIEKKCSVSIFVVFLILLCCKNLWALYPPGFFSKPVDVPPRIAALETASAVAPFLPERAAIRKLGQIGSVESVNLLVKTFKEQPDIPPGMVDAFPVVRMDIAKALGNIKIPEAKKALYDIIEEYIARGLRIEGGEKKVFDPEYYPVLLNALDSLSRWRGDDDVFEFLNKFAFDKNVLAPAARMIAYKNYLLADMSRQRIGNLKDAVHYLIGKWTKGGTYGTNEAMINNAISWIIEEGDYEGNEELCVPEGVRYGKMGKNVLPFLHEELKNIPADEQDRYHALDVLMRYLDAENKTTQ